MVDGVVYVSTDSGEVVAVDALSGEVRWRSDEAGYYSSPAVAGGLIFAGNLDGSEKAGGQLVALDAATGVLRWTFATGADIYGSPVVSDGAVFVEDDAGVLYAVEASSGTERWRATIATQGGVGPAVSKGTVFVGGLDTGDLLALDAATGRERWRFDLGDGTLSSPAIAEDVVYTTGARLIDEETAEGDLIAIDSVSGMERWRFPMETVSHSSPAVVDGTVYVGDVGGVVYAVDAETGTEIWRMQTGEYIAISSPGVTRQPQVSCSSQP